MAATWNQGGQPPNQYPVAPQRRTTNPPPVCFNCGVEGHFVINCPQPSRGNPAGFAAPAAQPSTPYQQFPVQGTPAQQYQPRPGPPQAQYSSYPPNTQYGQPPPQQPYIQPPQAYAPTPPVNPHPPFAHPGFQPPAYNQPPQVNGPAQFGSQPYQGPPQQYGPQGQGPTPYQTPHNSYTPQNSGYQGPPQHVQAPPQQWNNQNAQPYQQTPQRSASFSSSQRDYSRTPGRQPPQQPFQPQQTAPGPVQTPQTPLPSTTTARQGQWHQNLESPSGKKTGAFKASTPASATTAPHETNTPNAAKSSSVTSNDKQRKSTPKLEKVEVPEDGEVTELDDEEEQWEWDYRHIFPDTPVHETVALAQPLGAGFDSTPVPLIESWSTTAISISRYARKDNVKEFIRSVRVSPQWSFVQADPAFSDSPLDGPLIPIDEIFEWAAARHAKADTDMTDVDHQRPEEGGSRKRLRPEDPEEEANSEQEDVDNQIQLEARNDSQNDGPPNKRQKNNDTSGQEVQTTYGSTTPVLSNARGGTPFLPTGDDAWAPEPGERATSPGDPTEALLASLGVSGSPKPVKAADPFQPCIPSEDQSPQQRLSETPVASQPGLIPPPPPQAPVGSQPGIVPSLSSQVPQAGPPNSIPQPNSTHNGGPPMNNGYPNGPAQYGPPVNQSYGNGQHIQQNMNGSPQNRQPINAPFQNGPPSNVPFPNSQHGPPVQQGPPSYGPPTNQPYYYGPPQNYTQPPVPQYQPPRPAYGNPAPYNTSQPYPQYSPPQAAPYGPQQYGPPVTAPQPQGPSVNTYQQQPQQYGPARNPSFGGGPPVPGPYGPQQYSPAQYGPPQNQTYVNQQYPSQPYPNGPNPAFGNGPGSQPNVPFQNGQPAQPPFSNGPGQMPHRQDSGYGSARGSYSNGGGASDFNGQNAAYGQGQQPSFNAHNGPQQQSPQTSFNSQTTMQEQLQAESRNYPQQSNPQNNFNHQNSQHGGQSQAQQGGFNNQNSVQQQGQQHFLEDPASNQNQTEQPSALNSTQNEASEQVAHENPPTQENMSRKGSIGDMGDSPLSPTSAEILGKLEGKPNVSKTDHARRKKKPQPVVAAAYSRRW